MKLDFSDIIKQLKKIETDFNASDDPEERYALICALNHLAEQQIPIHGHWEDTYRKAMLRNRGLKV
jgi:hypothetical protein